MTEDNKARCREEIERRNWNRVGIIEPEPILFWDKEVSIIYENMDGQPCMCKALVKHENGNTYFRATNGDAKGNRMCGVIAYKEIK